MSSLTHDSGPTYWRSLDELARTPEFEEAVRREFPGDDWDRLPPATRRQFLRVMGASLAFAGLTACRWPKEEIVPFASRPEGRIPGVPQHFATAFELAGVALGMLVTSYDGRPIKAEGNPEHPDSRGALSAIAQACVLGLYDPDRSRQVVLRSGGGEFAKSWDDATAELADRIIASGEGLAVLSEASSSPSLHRLRERLLAARPAAAWYEYEAIDTDNEREGLRAAFGRPLRVLPRLERTRVVACFDADPLLEHPAAVRLARSFAESRDPHRPGGMSRLYVVEPGYSLTGGRADHRLAVPASQVTGELAAIASLVMERIGLVVPPGVARAGASRARSAFVTSLADDLLANRGAGAVLVGRRQGPLAHAVAAALNDALGNAGEAVAYLELADQDRPGHLAAIRELAGRIAGGSVQTLLILGGNPVYDAPSDLRFGELLGEVPNALHLSLYDDETSRRCRWHLPQAHPLEAWGDGRAFDGTLTLQQPLIEPLYGGRTAIEVVAGLLGPGPVRGWELVRETVGELAAAEDFEAFWRRSLHDGLVAGTAALPAAPSLDLEGVARLALAYEPPPAPSAASLELVLGPDSKVWDGRFANNGWLQELPEAVTKITWGSALLLSPATARELGVATGELVVLSAGGASLEAPVDVLPGLARHTAVLPLGYGRTAAGTVGSGVGVDASPLRSTDSPRVVTGVNVRPTGRTVKLACTQDHHAIDTIGFGERNRRVPILVREASVGAYLEDPEIFRHMDHHPPLKQLWKEGSYEGEQWGMAIDLNACTGCNACVVACHAENNIPLVGREQVIRQREMHWLRVDRYFRTPAGVVAQEVEDAAMVFQPVACVHCENAPCEQVCPVAATQHTRDGLNAMAYNRCIGTRYCSNNCPYKVRRFNFFNYRRRMPDTAKMQLNPEVTVRSRGVMEKCTYCVQRIEKARIAAGNERRPIRDDEVVPACAQTCPARAIHFGNLNDPDSAVSRLSGDHRSYATLVELNIRPRTRYLARLSNPAVGSPAPAAGGDDHGKETA
jgi:molybdopterin-containing oxidoreductase family iron-sulfur binding subunit